MNKQIIIIDGNSLINRAYYAMQTPMITAEGIYTQGIFGFMNMLNKIMEDQDPAYAVVAWDKKAPTFRHKAYKEYKAGRKKMPPELAMELPIMKDILNALTIKSVEMEGFEADDLIGTISLSAEEHGLEPLIITGDKDALQLASHKTKVMITRRGISQFDLYDYDKMIEVYDLTPEQFIDLKGLMGDKSDNIPGVPGVGEKTGINLLKQFGSIDEVIKNTDEIKQKGVRKKIEENAHLAVMSRKLAEINRHVPYEYEIEDFKLGEPDYEELVKIYVKLEFNSFIKKLKTNMPDAVEEDFFNNEMPVKILEKMEDLKELESLSNGEHVTIKVQSDFNHVKKPEIESLSIMAKNQLFFIKGRSVPQNLFDTAIGQDSEDLLKSAIEILNGKDLLYSGHNLKDTYFALSFYGLDNPITCFDSSISSYVIDSAKSTYDLKVLLFENFTVELPEDDPYGIFWCQSVNKIEEKQKKEIKKQGLEEIIEDVEFPLIEVLSGMEKEGFSTNIETLDDIGQSLKGKIETLQKEIYDLAGSEFNINSPKQLGVVLFEDLGLTSGKKTKTGYSTSADILEKIKNEHPIVDKVLYYRTLTKLESTYVEGLKPLIADDGRIRAHFKQTVAQTGRISCTEPNLQNIPVRDEMGRLIRKAFIPSEGNILVGADYSQIELRILAHLSGDENLIEAFNNGEDIHRKTASRVFDIPYDEVTSLDRSRAKAVNFGVIYGMSSFGLSEELNITRKQAQNYIDDYFAKHVKVKEYMDGQLEFAKKHGYTETILGRRRYINEINSSNFRTRQFGERLAMNSPIQGSAADVIKLAMIAVDKELKERNLGSKLILQVHDELIIDTKESEKEIVQELLMRNMTEAYKLKVNLIADLNTGNNWFELK